jgi:hypothetical protein
MFDLVIYYLIKEYDRVKPIQNYTQWKKREVSIENLSLDLLNIAIRTAESFVISLDEKNKSKNEGFFNSNCIIS